MWAGESGYRDTAGDEAVGEHDPDALVDRHLRSFSFGDVPQPLVKRAMRCGAAS